MAKRKITQNQVSSAAPGAMPQGAGNTTVAESDRERIARRAYELYVQRGATGGRELDDWLTAERELTAQGQGKS